MYRTGRDSESRSARIFTRRRARSATKEERSMSSAVEGTIQPHNQRPAAVWSAGGERYNEISRGIADAIEHCVRRLQPQPNERILDLSTGTGWTSRVVAR